MIGKGFVTHTAFKKHLDGDWRTVHELWSHIRNYMTSYPAPADSTYTKTEIDAFFEGYSGGKAQVDAGNVVGLTQGSIPFADASGFLTEDNSKLTWDDTTGLNVDGNISIRNSKELRFYDNGNYVGFEAPALDANKIWVLPDADGDANDFLQTAGDGNLSWAAVDLSDVLIDGDFASAGIMLTDGAGTYAILPGGEDTTNHNLYIGTGALGSVTVGQAINNVCLGENAGTAITTGDRLIAIGYDAGKTLTTAGDCVYIGFEAGKIGTAAKNVAIGTFALRKMEGGDANTAIGYNAGGSLVNGVSNFFLGESSGLSTVSGSRNVFIGFQAGYYNLASHNVYIGGSDCGLRGTSAAYNICIGKGANYFNISGRSNITIGYEVAPGAVNQSHSYDVFIGEQSGFSVTTGSNNTALGDRTLRSITSGGGNVALGYQAGYSMTTNSASVFLGYQAGYNETAASKLYIANSNTANPLLYGEFPNTLLRINAPLDIGRDGALRGALTLWDGAGGNTPGYIKIHSPDGTAWYVFVEDDGTVKIHNVAPAANADGDAIGDQAD